MTADEFIADFTDYAKQEKATDIQDTDGTKFIETKGNLFDKLKKAVKQTFGSADKTKRQGAQAYIDVIEGMNRGARLVLEPGRQYLIGRQEDMCDLVVSNNSVISRVHCAEKFDSAEGTVTIYDKSSNGVTLGDGRSLGGGSTVLSTDCMAALQGTQLGGMRLAGIILAAVGFVLIAAGIVYGRGGKKEAAYKPNKTNKPEAITVTAESIIGDRKYQQDFFLFTPDTNSEAVKDSGMLAIVCDGMGGMEGGEIASRMCAELVYNGYYQMGKVDDVCQVLKELVTAADDEVSAITDQSGRKLRSGTTAIAVVVRGSKAYWVSAGDSRIYYLHNGRLERITRDHNFRLLLQEQCNAGYITQEEVETDGQKEALISYVGKGGNLLIDTGVIEFGSAKDDMILLCSDGLYKALTEEDIQRLMLQHAGNSMHLPKVLTRAAMAGGRPGKHDNITVLTVSKG